MNLVAPCLLRCMDVLARSISAEHQGTYTQAAARLAGCAPGRVRAWSLGSPSSEHFSCLRKWPREDRDLGVLQIAAQPFEMRCDLQGEGTGEKERVESKSLTKVFGLIILC